MVTLGIDADRLTYAVGNGRPRRLPAIVKHLAITWPSDTAGLDRSVRFFPDGSAAGCEIRLYGRHLTEMVAVDWLTGRVRRER